MMRQRGLQLEQNVPLQWRKTKHRETIGDKKKKESEYELSGSCTLINISTF